MHFVHNWSIVQQVGLLDTIPDNFEITLQLSHISIEDLLLLEHFLFDHLALLGVPFVTVFTVVVQFLRPRQHVVYKFDALTVCGTCVPCSVLHQNLVVVRLADEEEKTAAC